MQVQIIESKQVDYATIGRHVYATMKCGKHSMSVSIGKYSITAVMHNASNRAFKQLGKTYRNFDEALSNYKSSEARAMIEAARNLWNTAEVAA